MSTKKDSPKARVASRITAQERAVWTTGDPTLDVEIVKNAAQAVWEGGKWVYEWAKGEPPLVIHVLNSRYLNNHHIVTFSAENISPHGVYIEDITLDDAMQIVAFQQGAGEPKEFGTFGEAEGKWVRNPMSPNPQPPFQNTPLFPAYIAPMGTFSFNCAIQPSGHKKSATINFFVSPLSGKKVLKQPEVFRLRDR
jgi:hypothetical protein